MAENTPSIVAPRKMTSSARRLTNRGIGALSARIGSRSRPIPWGGALVPPFVPGFCRTTMGPMPVLSVDDAGDPRLADYIGIPDPQLARARGVFVAEGRLVVRRLLASRFVTRSVMVTATALGGVADLIDAQPCLPVFVVAQEVMNAI